MDDLHKDQSPTDLDDIAEAAFWRFDEERKRTGAERDAFKRQVRLLVGGAMSGATKAIEGFYRDLAKGGA